MAGAFKPPEYFVPGPNPAETWERWRQRYEIYYEASNMGSMQITQQRAILLHVIGEAGLQLYSTLEIEEENDARTITVILNAFSAYYRPYRNTTFKRHEFLSATQAEGQTVDDFVTELKLKARDCDFENLHDSLVRDRLLCGIRDENLRTLLLREPNLSLATAIDVCRTHETAQKQNTSMNTAEPQVVDYIKNKPKGRQGNKVTMTAENNAEKRFQNMKPFSDKTTKFTRKCSRCGRKHQPRNCPAYGKECRKCHRIGHFAIVCRCATANVIEEVNPEDNFFIGTLSMNKSKDWREKISVNGKIILFKLDTGADVNIIPANIFTRFSNKPELINTGKIISAYSGHNLNILGKCDFECTYKNRKLTVEFYIVETESPPILGLETCEKLRLISRLHNVSFNKSETSESILAEFKDVFEGVGRFPMEHTIKLKNEAIPKIHAARKIPFSLKERVKSELERMNNLGIITKVETPTEWVHPMVIVQKQNGSLRLCLDSRPLNEVLMREHYPLPTIEDLLSRLNGAKYFTTLDASSAFWQIPLSEESSYLTTFATPFGRFRFKRLPYGLSSAPEIFQRIFTECFEDLEGVLIYMDDLLIWGSAIEELNRRFESVLKRARKLKVKFSKEKLRIAMQKVEYIGSELTSEGIKITSSRIEAIQALKPPTCKKDLQSFLGMITYLTRFLENLSCRSAYLRSLLHKETEWLWDSQAQKEFERLKQMITDAPVLGYFNPSEEITISVDASSLGMGAVLMQNNKPIAYASVSLTSVQGRYAPIERELLAIVYGLEHFHNYIYGQSIVVKTDHKPLLAIVKKPYQVLTPRIQRMVLRLQRYQFNLVHVAGKDQHVADVLSRSPKLDTHIDTTYLEGEAGTVHTIVTVTPTKLNELKEATKADKELEQLSKYVKQGWPKRFKDVQTNLKPYWPYKEEIYEYDGLLFKSQRVIIPSTQKQDVLQKIHSAHQGIVACKEIAQEAVFWLNINKDIEKKIRQCIICQSYKPANQKEPLIHHAVQKRPWEKVGVDLMKIENKIYICAIDYFSKFIELQQLQNITAVSVINFLKATFARYGSPDVLMSDNGPPFSSTDFRNFCEQWDVVHETSSPTYPKSNGMVERAIQTVKGILIKSQKDGTDPHKALLLYRTTPHQGLPSPASLLMGRRLRTSLPVTEEHLKPQYDIRAASQTMKKNQEVQKQYADRNSKPLPQLKRGQPILYYNSNRNWLPATVKEVGPQPRSYVITTPSGVCYRRNRVHLRPRFEQSSETTNNTPRKTVSDYSGVTPKIILSKQVLTEQQSSEAQNSKRQADRTPSRRVYTRSGRFVLAPKRLISE